MSDLPPNTKVDIETIKNEILQEIDTRIFQVVPTLIDESTRLVETKFTEDDDTSDDEVVSGVNLLFLNNKEYIESEPSEGGGYPEFGEVQKGDGQGNHSIKVSCKIVDDEESSEYWEIDYSIVELPD